MTDPRILELAEKHLTAKQYEAWRLIHVHKLSARSSALRLGWHRSTFIGHYDAACLNLSRLGVLVDASGNPYLTLTNEVTAALDKLSRIDPTDLSNQPRRVDIT